MSEPEQSDVKATNSGAGREPEVQTTLANERTYLAWLRTAMALVASGIAVERLLPEFGFQGARPLIGIVLVGVGAFIAAGSGFRWRKIDAAIRSGEPLPPPTMARLIAATIAVAGVIIILLLVFKP